MIDVVVALSIIFGGAEFAMLIACFLVLIEDQIRKGKE